MYGITPLILIVLPLLFQIIIGTKSIREDFKLKFGTVCLISLLLQILLSFVSIAIASYNFEQSLGGKEYRCGMGLLGIFGLIFIFSVLLLITMIVQYFVKKYYERNKKRLNNRVG
jgi:hypothetical protein